MPKINQEEYEVLKEHYDMGGEWIARDADGLLYYHKERPNKLEHSSDNVWDSNSFPMDTIGDGKKLFHFVRWTDSEPYNIAELIEEYEEHEFVKINQAGRERLNKLFGDESEETEVKNIEWLKEKVQKRIDKLPRTYSGLYIDGSRDAYHLALKDINQLDEQEEVKRAQIPEWIIEWYQGANNEFSTLEDVFSNLSHDTNYNIMDSDKFRSRIMKYGGFSKMYEALSHIYFGAYEIEEEQKYVVEFPNITGSDERYLVQGEDGDLWVDGDLDYLQRFDIPKHIFTEEEIKSFDKDYWAFAKPVEELEE